MKKNKEYFHIFIRYILLLLIVLFFTTEFFLNIAIKINLVILNYFFSFFTKPVLIKSVISIKDGSFFILKECIAPQAYILITLVFFTLPLNIRKIFKIWGFSIILFSIFNLIRILFLIIIFFKLDHFYFEKLHFIFYEIVSGIFTGLMIVYFVKKEKIKTYPIISDINIIIKKH